MSNKYDKILGEYREADIDTQYIQVMQTALLDDFSNWTLTDLVLNGSNQLILADA